MGELFNSNSLDKSLRNELKAIKNRVRNLIGDSHWGKEGEYKEFILKRIIRRNIQKKYSVGTGFVVFKTEKEIRSSTQIDILIWDSQNYTQAINDDLGDFYIVEPESVRAIIEVKTTLKKNECINAFLKMNKIAYDINKYNFEIGRPSLMTDSNKYPPIFSGIFFYDGYKKETEGNLKYLLNGILKDTRIEDDIKNSYHRGFSPAINFLTLGENIFARYNYYKYEIHKISNLAYSSFINSINDRNESIVKRTLLFTIDYELPNQEKIQIEL